LPYFVSQSRGLDFKNKDSLICEEGSVGWDLKGSNTKSVRMY